MIKVHLIKGEKKSMGSCNACKRLNSPKEVFEVTTVWSGTGGYTFRFCKKHLEEFRTKIRYMVVEKK